MLPQQTAAQAPLSSGLLDQIHQLAAQAKPETQLPTIGDSVSKDYGVPVSRALVAEIAAFRPNLNADLRNPQAHFSIVTLPGVTTSNSKTPSRVQPQSMIEGVCGYEITTTWYTLDHYVNNVLVSSELIGTAVTGRTALYCSDGYTNDIIDLSTIDCNATPDDPICALALVPPGTGKGCQGSDSLGYVLGSQAPLGSSGKSDEVINIFYLWETVPGSSFQQPVGYVLSTQNGWYVGTNGNDPIFWSTEILNHPLDFNWTSAAVDIMKSTNALSPALSGPQINDILHDFPFGKTGVQGTGSCFSAPLPLV